MKNTRYRMRIEDRGSKIEDRIISPLLFLALLFASLAPGEVFAQQPAPPPPAAAEAPRAAATRTGAITGRVLGEDGVPAATANIYVTPVTSGPQMSGRTIVTDAEGNFVIPGLTAQSYRLMASLPGYVTEGDLFSPNYYHIGDAVTLNLIKGGVITGRVVNATGEPVIAVVVSVVRVRDAEGKPLQEASNIGRVALTDDRGIYRLYGLRPGSYLVVANGGGFTTTRGTPYDGEVPTYYPSSPRDTANEVQVMNGTVASGIDIRYRAEPGRIISGKISGATESSNANMSRDARLTLRQFGTGAVVANSYGGSLSSGSYEMRGVPDGDYEISAARFDYTDGAASPWRRVTVRGADVGGIDLVLAPLASIAGRVVLEPAKAELLDKCTLKRPTALSEALLRLRRDDGKPNELPLGNPFGSEAGPDEKGAFTLYNFAAGRYRLLPALPGEAWYVKAIVAATAVAPVAGRRTAAAPATTAGNLFTLKASERVSGVTVTLAEGAAALQGQVGSDNDVKLAGRWRVLMVPVEQTAADDVLRYYETPMRNDGVFVFKQLAPGKYWLLTRPAPEDESAERPGRPLAWEQTERLKLRREAEAAKQEIELTACQRVNDVKLPAPRR
jgi:hypothetical protein